MKVKVPAKVEETLEAVQAKAAYAARRAVAVRQHVGKVVGSGVGSARQIGSELRDNVGRVLKAEKTTLTDKSLPLKQRAQKIRTQAVEGAQSIAADLRKSGRQAYADLTDSLTRVTAVTHAEQAEENRIARKAKKAAKTRLASSSA